MEAELQDADARPAVPSAAAALTRDAVALARDWWADMAVHGVGLAVGTAGAVVLLIKVAQSPVAGQWPPVVVYVAGLLAMLGCSAAYNAWGSNGRRPWLRRLDHAAIFAMIAGTYTPLALLRLAPPWDVGLTALVWTVAGLGIVLKLWRPGRIEAISVVLYLALGWIGVLAAHELLASVPAGALALIVAGGIVYSAGVVFHVLPGLYRRALWHLCVLAGAALHFFAVESLVGP